MFGNELIAVISRLETTVCTKGYLWWRIIIPSTVWRRIRSPLSWHLTRDCGRSFYGIVLRTSQGTCDRIRCLTSRARDIGMLARAAKWSTWKCPHVRSVPYNKWEDRIYGYINERNKTIKTGATLAAALICVCWSFPKSKVSIITFCITNNRNGPCFT